ncbi:MAG: 3-dehydroquinate synthase [Candidatus Omnitrophica bacterium]|nr:3-dehydroquinate synthase [Candidatus Omnitrophota bacterium]
MRIVKVNLRERSYNIITGDKVLSLAGKYILNLDIGKDAYVITNTNIKNRYGDILRRNLEDKDIRVKFKPVPDTERSKSLSVVFSILKDVIGYDKNKIIFFVAFGGGVIGDLTGFIASIYKRGMPYIQIPTTFLAQVDSSVGGKTAVDLPEAKNLIGTFYQPRLVISDIFFLRTLDLRQIRSGLAEVIKYGVIKDTSLFLYLKKRWKDLLALERDVLESVVVRCIRVKADIVEQDETEKKQIRTILNFGHTLGHAIEAAAGYTRYTHGEAVALGMLLSLDISKRLHLLDVNTSQQIEDLIKEVGLPTRIESIGINKIIGAYYRDKKFIGWRNRFVLLEDIGRPRIVENIPLRIIKEVLKKRIVAT